MARQLKAVLAQLNFVVGDIEGNTQKVIDTAQVAVSEHKADLVAFPELTLTGYPPEDLLLRPSLGLRVEKAIQKLLEADLSIFCVVGFPERIGDSLFNSLAVIRGGEIVAKYKKQCLPNYQVFDERRYFDHGDSACVVDICGVPTAFTICEDMWEPEPVAQARDAGARLMFNINASPFHMGKQQLREQLLAKRCQEGGFPIVYVNLVGGQDELVFDGRSMAVDASGKLKFLCPAFEEGIYPVCIDIDSEGSADKLAITIALQEIAQPLSREAEVYESLVLGVRDYINKNGFKGVVLGLSGGIDSALTLAIAVDALGADRVKAVMMPFEYTSELSLSAASIQAERQGVEYSEISIAAVYSEFINSLRGEFKGLEADVSEQNLQARCRGVLLMAISNKKGLLVLTTGNKSEIAVGYSTLYGDMAGGFDVLKDVSKTMVYRLANYRNADYGDSFKETIPQVVIDRPPSAELAPDQEDQDSLPPYDILDQVLEYYVEQDLSAQAIVAKGFETTMVHRVLRLVDLNEYKRRQSPVGVRLTQRGFGRDRRYPITNAWKIGE
ncbi:MAG: NAD+ synthase (glutamine-hydrolyzing) [Pseudohongiellaceae bacterium]|jgi:NAD+ synthase (glutamine-hydrolysing)